jgi:hypothetical protein
VIDDLAALQDLHHRVVEIAVVVVELNLAGDVVQVAPGQIVTADDLVAFRQEGVGQVAAEEPCHTTDKDLHSYLQRTAGTVPPVAWDSSPCLIASSDTS